MEISASASFRWMTTTLPPPPSVCRRDSPCFPHSTFNNNNNITRINQNNNNRFNFNHQLATRRRNLIQIPAAIPADQVDLSWEIIVGALAGVTPFVVAGIEFSKRIVAQRRCGVCKGSGLVKREKYYFRCPRCGGFLPWQSWKRFFQVKQDSL